MKFSETKNIHSNFDWIDFIFCVCILSLGDIGTVLKKCQKPVGCFGESFFFPSNSSLLRSQLYFILLFFSKLCFVESHETHLKNIRKFSICLAADFCRSISIQCPMEFQISYLIVSAPAAAESVLDRWVFSHLQDAICNVWGEWRKGNMQCRWI